VKKVKGCTHTTGRKNRDWQTDEEMTKEMVQPGERKWQKKKKKQRV